ncbi:hypothetical protein NEMBOFW57_005874 [Staphylotrichum longicolle]|uniref:Mediator of RNA polymerase II transcription subunit 6 n=1 Tax=Staphylotrichum longicolle TaxID=669026 RepID=A0AAD4I1Z5_9PEZI|nr:hypothetical protein NEMBOFW57_005874 [Staphylotrichum longicolle]
MKVPLDPAPNTGPPLDEIQWRSPPEFEMGIHSNSVLFYFAQSPFYDRTSNNEVLFQQGLNNPNMTPYLATRELFEGRIKTMSGLEFIVAQEPAETGPGAGTGVWVINKQTRRKRQGEDEIIVHGTYFVNGENIYMAPSMGDVISSRLAAISTSVAKMLPISSGVHSWLIEEALGIHHQFGEHHLDENPITGKPGDFQLSSTGRNGGVNLSAAAAANLKKASLIPTLPTLNTKLGGVGGGTAAENPLAAKPSGKETKSPRTPGAGGGGLPKGKKRKGSKAAVTPQ